MNIYELIFESEKLFVCVFSFFVSQINDFENEARKIQATDSSFASKKKQKAQSNLF